MEEKQIMKAIASVILLIIAASAFGQSREIRRIPPPPPTPEEATQKLLDLRRPYFVHQWCEIDRLKYYTRASNWVQFVGEVIQVHSDGIRIRGWYGPPMTWPKDNGDSIRPDEKKMVIPLRLEFFVKKYPYQVTDGSVIHWEQNCLAMLDSPYRYNTVGQSTRTLPALKFGRITTPPPPAARPKAAKKASTP